MVVYGFGICTDLKLSHETINLNATVLTLCTKPNMYILYEWHFRAVTFA